MVSKSQLANEKELPKLKIRAEIEKRLIQRLVELSEIRASTNSYAAEILDVLIRKRMDGSSDEIGFLKQDEDSEVINRIREQQAFSETFVKETKQDLYNLYGDCSVSIWMIREVAYMFLSACRIAFARYIKIESAIYDWLRDDDISLIANLVTAMYVESWLENDESSYQTPYGFATHPYRKEDRSAKKIYSEITAGEKSRVQRVYRRQEVLYNLRQKQLRRERCVSTYRQYKKKANGRQLNLITLARIEAESDNALSLLDYLFYNKNIMDREEDVRKRKSTGLESACQDYHSYIKRIDSLNTSKTASIDVVRKFVASSMLIHKIERAYHFHLNAGIAERICKGEIDPTQFDGHAWLACMGRFAGSGDQLFSFSWEINNDAFNLVAQEQNCKNNSKKTYTYINEPVDILNNDYYINLIFCKDGKTQSKAEATMLYLRRQLIQDVLKFVVSLYPPTEQHPWQNFEFRAAADFYREYYPITTELSKVKFPSLPNKRKRNQKTEADEFYRYFKVPYEHLNSHPDGELAKARKELSVVDSRKR